MLDPIADRVARLLPDVRINELKVVNSGMNCETAIVNNDLIVQFKKRTDCDFTGTHAARIAQKLKPFLTTVIPDPLLIRDDAVVYTLIKGRALSALQLSALQPLQRKDLARDLAAFLRDLHAVPPAVFQEFTFRTPSIESEIQSARKTYERVQTELYPLMNTDGVDWIDQHFQAFLAKPDIPDRLPVLIHGDLSPEHILIGNSGTLAGIIDFGATRWGYPGDDLWIPMLMYGEDFIQELALYYSEITQWLNYARFYAGLMLIQWCLNGLQENRPRWFFNHLNCKLPFSPLRKSCDNFGV